MQTLNKDLFISEISGRIKAINPSTVKGIGDDAAVLGYGKTLQLFSTDSLLEGIHFDLMYVPVKHLGYKSAIAGFSDIYAMNGSPKQIMVSIAVSSKCSQEWVTQLYEGIELACAEYGADLVGGDISASITGTVINISVIGEVLPDKIVYRNGMQDGDLICVSGELGGAYLGLQILEREKRLFEKNEGFKPVLDGYDYVIGRQLRPSARKDIISFFNDEGIRPTAMIDISKGLVPDLKSLCSSSELGCKLYEHKIPLDDESLKVASELNQSPYVAAMYGGQDYELLFSVPVGDYDKILKNGDISILGHAIAESNEVMLFSESGDAVL